MLRASLSSATIIAAATRSLTPHAVCRRLATMAPSIASTDPPLKDLLSTPPPMVKKPYPSPSGPQSTSSASTQRYQATADKHITSAVGRLRNHVFASGSGLQVQTTDGRQLLDFTSGIGVTSLGHAHPAVTAAIVDQASSIVHVQCGIALSKPYVELVEQLVTMMPSPTLDSFFLWSSGSEAIEAAIKLARTKTRRNNIIVMQGGYHGRTAGAAALTRSKTSFFAGTGPLMPCVYTTAFPYWHALGLPQDTSDEELVRMAVHQLEQTLAQQSAPSDTAAIFVEPVIGEGGYVPAPPAFLRALRETCSKHGILLVVDEIQTGFGRTGANFAIEHSEGVIPDIMTFAKGFANGMPLSGVVTRKEIMDCMPAGSLGGTYAGNAVACAAALATTKYMVQTDVLGNVQRRGEQLAQGLRDIVADKENGGDIIAEVRGTGVSRLGRLVWPLSFSFKQYADRFCPFWCPHLSSCWLLSSTALLHHTPSFPPTSISWCRTNATIETYWYSPRPSTPCCASSPR